MLLIHRIANESNEDLRAAKWASLLQFFRDEFGSDFNGEYLRLYSTVHSTRPGDWDASPLAHELVNEIRLAGAGAPGMANDAAE